MSRQLWVADACRAAGLPVVEVDGWRTRGNESFSPAGLVCHHTGGAATGDMPSLRVLINGRSDLPGPLCQFGLSRSGKVYIVAAGRANHAGKGGWKGLSGNSSVFGIEAENSGGQAWPEVQVNAYIRLSAVIAKRANFDVSMVCGHKEWAPGRKPDPHTIDMNWFREQVRRVVAGVPPDQDEEEDEIMNERFVVRPGETLAMFAPAVKRGALPVSRAFLLIGAPYGPAVVRVSLGQPGAWRGAGANDPADKPLGPGDAFDVEFRTSDRFFQVESKGANTLTVMIEAK